MIASMFLFGGFMILTVGKDVYPFSLYFGHTGHRSDDVQKALIEFQKSTETVLIGIGPRQFLRERPWGDFSGVENEVVRQLVEGGIIGCTVFLIWVFTPVFIGLFVSMKSKDPDTSDAGAILAFSFVLYSLSGFISVDIFDGGHGHLMVMLAGMIFSIHREYSHEGEAALKTRVPAEKNGKKTKVELHGKHR